MTLFRDRYDAGKRLAERLAQTPLINPIVLALPRGGVPVGYEIAQELGAPLDIVLVRKLGVPGQEELALGAIATGGACVYNEQVLKLLPIAPSQIEQVVIREERELDRRARIYRGDRPPPVVKARTAILVDDGLATGATMRAAAQSLRGREPRSIIAAVPVGAPESCRLLGEVIDEMICLERPDFFRGVARWYDDFGQIGDDEVRRLLGHPDTVPASSRERPSLRELGDASA